MNKTNFDRATSPKDILLYAVAYLLWFVNILVCVEAIIQSLALIDLFWAVTRSDRYALSLVNQAFLLVGGFIAFVYVMSLEHNYRACVDHEETDAPARNGRLRILLRYFARTTAIPLTICLVALAVLWVSVRIFP